jgi:hypothetical protein
MTDNYKRKDDNGKNSKSYRQTKLEQNIWRCDCSDEGKHIDIRYHESGCNYGAWYTQNDMGDKGD